MTTGLPLVSVVIPTYNRAPMIGQALESVLSQSYRDFELIVVDDGSTDGTAVLLDRYQPALTVLSQPHRGVAAARNAGISASSGKYIAFLDSDDFWLPAKLAVQVEFLKCSTGVEICQTNEIWMRNGRRVNPKLKHRKPSGDVFRRSLDLCLISPSAVMMTRELFDSVGGFDESFVVCEDYDLWLRIALGHPVYLIEEALVTKRGGHADQLSRSVWGMDRFRALSLIKLLRTGLDGEKRQWALAALREKVDILAAGAKKRGKQENAAGWENIWARCLKEFGDVGTKDPGIRRNQRLSSAHRAALA